MATMTMSDLRKNTVPAVVEQPATAAGFSTAGSFELIQRAAKCLASSDLLPERYRGNIPNAVIALDMANRMGAAPLMVCQNLYVVHGTPSWSAQFLVATFNQCGKYSALRYQFEGEPGTDGWGCRAWAVELATGERLEGSLVTINLAKREGWYQKSGSKWQTMPEQMLRYRAAAWFIRAHAPEIAMGLPMREEVVDTYDVPEEDITVVPVKAETAPEAPAAAAPAPAPDPKSEPKPEPKPGAPKPAPAPTPAPAPAKAEPPFELENEKVEQPKEEAPVAKKKTEMKDTPQYKLIAALQEQCDGDKTDMQKLLNTAVGNEKYKLEDVPGFTDFVANTLLRNLEEHLKKLEKAGK